MSIFSAILQKLGIQKPATSAPSAPITPLAGPGATVAPTQNTPTTAPATPPPARPAAIPMVDVVSKLDGLAKSHPGCDWKVSIADLLQLLGLDNSYAARKELATELGCPANLMNDSASMNTWLHKTVLQKLAENGGNIPESLLH
jgi:Domain of unknown function (DUF3597)